MEYRRLGKTDLKVSGLGLGTEHMEKSSEDVERILHHAIDAGVNYLDLFFWEQLGSIVNPHRDDFILAAHWEGLEEILAKVVNGYVEIGMLTMIDTETKWAGWAQESLERLQRYKEQGRVGYIGISSHRAPVAVKAVNSGLIDVLMYPVEPGLSRYRGRQGGVPGLCGPGCRACGDEALCRRHPICQGRQADGDHTCTVSRLHTVDAGVHGGDGCQEYR